jgi:hypothetical protein
MHSIRFRGPKEFHWNAALEPGAVKHAQTKLSLSLPKNEA